VETTSSFSSRLNVSNNFYFVFIFTISHNFDISVSTRNVIINENNTFIRKECRVVYSTKRIMEIRTYPFGPLQANLYVIAFESDAIIIDPCVPYQSLGLEGSKVRGIICTHSHYDHIVEAENIRSRTGSLIYAYEDEKEAIMDADMNGSSLFFEALSVSPPIGGLNDGDILTARDFKIDTKDDFSLTVIHTPGHTYGSMCLLFKVKTGSEDKEYLFSGDTIFAGSIGRTDLGGSMPDMISSIKLLSRLPDDVIVLPGHGQSTTIGKEKKNNHYFTSINYDDII